MRIKQEIMCYFKRYMPSRVIIAHFSFIWNPMGNKNKALHIICPLLFDQCDTRTRNFSFVSHIRNWFAGGPPRLLITGSWSPQYGLNVSHSSMFERRKNLTGTTITDTVLPWPPITIVEKDDQGEMYQSGITCALFNHCTSMSYLSGNCHTCNLPS